MSYDPYCFSLWFLFLHLSIWRRQTSSTKWMEKIESEMFRTKYDPEEMTHTHYFFVSRKLWMFVYICIVSISIIIFNQKKKHHKISGEIISVDFPVFFETMWSFILKVDGPSLCEFDTKYSQSNNYTDLLTTHWKHENIYSYTILYEIRCRYVMLF